MRSGPSPCYACEFLGPRILRAETAAIAGLARLQGAGCGYHGGAADDRWSYMSNPGDANSTPIASVRQLADHIAVGCKPREQFRIGTEHEKFGFRVPDLTAPPYLPADGHPGAIRDLLECLAGSDGEPTKDHGNSSRTTPPGRSIASRSSRPASSSCRAQRWRPCMKPRRS